MARHPELLIPASSLEVLKTAVMFGADAVYIGGEAFGLRAKAKNFSMEEMKEGIAFAISNTPGSAMINASGLISFNSLKYSRTPERSSLCARILAVTYTFTSCSCANAIPSFISSMEKFFAFARSPNASPPM